jgi:hypothetical protein
MGDEIDGAMQHAPQPTRHIALFSIACLDSTLASFLVSISPELCSSVKYNIPKPKFEKLLQVQVKLSLGLGSVL